ncbi:MAG: transposase [Pirellulaceae bacterium]
MDERHTECACYFLLLLGERIVFELFDPKGDVRKSAGTNLPHWYQSGVTYFVTFRTEDSIPPEVSRRWYAERSRWLQVRGITVIGADWKEQFAELPKDQQIQFHETFSRQFLENLDKGWGECALRRSELSKVVADSLLYFDADRYHIGDFVVMPNHVHLLVCLIGDTDIVSQCYSWKKFAAGKINKVLGKVGRFWQEDSFDHLVRSPEQFATIQRYIAMNPRNLPNGHYHLRLLK